MKSIKLKEVQAKLQEIKTFYSEATISPENNYDDLKCGIDCLYNELQFLYRYISNVEDMLLSHAKNGHLPPIIGPDKLTKAIKILGLDGDYEVNKRQIWASNGQLKSTEIILKAK